VPKRSLACQAFVTLAAEPQKIINRAQNVLTNGILNMFGFTPNILVWQKI
jgi:hypothetical protein